MALPEFLIIGAPKCGTTSLADGLARHPDVFIPERKELGFFDANWEEGLPWFTRYFETAGRDQLRGEATPDYFATPLAAERIARTNPACKLIVLAREPVQRAHSHYWFRWNTGRERRSIDQVIDDELRSRDATADGYLIRHGLYGQNLEVYRRLFGASSLHVVSFVDLVRDPQRVLAEAQRFLGLALHELVLEQANAARRPYLPSLTRAIAWFSGYQGFPKRALRAVVGDARRTRIRHTILRALSRPIRNPPLSERARTRLSELYTADSAHFQRALGRSLWGAPNSGI